jgi:hypothetical protein
VLGSALVFDGYEALSGLMFRSYRGADLATGTELVVQLPGTPGGGAVGWLPWLVVPAALLAMAAVLLGWLRRTGEATRADPIVETAEGLAAQIAALDAEYAGRGDESYRARRAELKARLTDALARGRASR